MSNYYNRLNTIINYREDLKQIEETRKNMISLIEEYMENCNHEILITFGEMESYRCYGVGEKYYCPFCSKRVIKYLNSEVDILKNHIIIDLKDLSIENTKGKNNFFEIQKQLYSYLINNKEANILEIKDFITSLNINELLPKVRKIN